jgi:hypothetical protein
MTLFGLSDYWERGLKFEIKQGFNPHQSFSRKYPWLFFGIGLLGLLFMYSVHALYPKINALYLLFGAGLMALIIDIALIPLRVRMWRDWYQSLSSEDKAELRWLTKRHIIYTGSLILICIGLLLILIVTVRTHFP